jgi:hypothetical protein
MFELVRIDRTLIYANEKKRKEKKISLQVLLMYEITDNANKLFTR